MRRTISALAILISLSTTAVAAETMTRHGMAPKDAQQFFDEMNAKGWRYRNVDTVATSEGVRYAMTFSKEKQPQFLARSGLSAVHLQAALDEAVKDSLRPVALSVADMGDGQFAVIFEKNDGRAWYARHGLSLENLQTVLAEQAKAGRSPADIDCYNADGQTNYAALFVANGDGLRQVWMNLAASAWQSRLESMMSKGYRPARLNVCSTPDGPRFAGIFEPENGRLWRARHNMTAAQFQKESDDNAGKGLLLADISAYRSDDETLFAAIWVK
jgi:hypothetical protein